jgi:aspartate aminotransferase-like enzyme
MPGLLPHVDPDGLLEYSVVYTDRALNHMSARFGQVMRDIAAVLRQAHGASSVAVVPGSGTFGMEAAARQFATGRAVLVLRNGWFSYRWSQILQAGSIASSETVLRARPDGPGPQAAWSPAPLGEVVAAIRARRPAVVFAPHVETSAGILLTEDYLREVGRATREVGGLFVADAIASGAVWLDMAAVDVDVLVSAPQKGWSGSPCCAFVMLGERARAALDATTSTSFAADLRRWVQIMESYEAGSHGYHATLPTDALARTRDAMLETRGLGLKSLRDAQFALGDAVRERLRVRGFAPVAARGWQAPGVVVCHTDDPLLHSGRAFAEAGLQTAAGVPLQCDEPAGFRTFRIGLFGIDKLRHPQRTVAALERALEAIAAPVVAARAVA